MIKSDEVTILQYMNNEKIPVGAIYLSKKLNKPQTTIGRILLELEKDNYVKKVSNKGRVITKKGRAYLNDYEEENKKIKTAIKIANIYNEVSKDKLIEILEVRKLIEGKIVELACENASQQQFNELDIILAKYEIAVKSDKLGNEEDLSLHLKIAEMSDNKTLYYICNLLLTSNNAYTHFSMVTENIKNQQLEQHNHIVNAIKNRDKSTAKEFITIHLNQIISDVEQNID